MPTNSPSHTGHVHPADNIYSGNFVGVTIWSAVEPIAGIFGAVSSIPPPSFNANVEILAETFSVSQSHPPLTLTPPTVPPIPPPPLRPAPQQQRLPLLRRHDLQNLPIDHHLLRPQKQPIQIQEPRLSHIRQTSRARRQRTSKITMARSERAAGVRLRKGWAQHHRVRRTRAAWSRRKQ